MPHFSKIIYEDICILIQSHIPIEVLYTLRQEIIFMWILFL